MKCTISNRAAAKLARHATTVTAALMVLGAAGAGAAQSVAVRAAGFTLGAAKSGGDGTNQIAFVLADANGGLLPYTQSAVKQGTDVARLGPDLKAPYFTVRFAMPIPPENLPSNFAALTGIDPEVFTHNNSPGFAILPNGDALAIYFSTPPGKAEADPSTSFIQVRLRYGAEEWDMPELFLKTENYNDQSGLLWNDGGTIRFFGGGRALSDYVPFKLATSTDNGASWTLSLPQLDKPAADYTAQPITSAFRGADHSMYFAMDADKAQSFLWHSTDEGIHWEQSSGRTSGRHSVIVPLDDKGDLLSIGGKNAAVDGWSPENTSKDWGATWTKSKESPFPPLGSAQRPSLIKLADGNLFFVSDAYLHKAMRVPPAGWKNGNNCFVALSTNNGTSWQVKVLPVQLPNHERGTNGTLGYVTARQAANGIIHVLTTETQPCLHYELNEAWILSNLGDITPESTGGSIKEYSENYPNGTVRAQWSARICPNGRYLLDGKETDFYANGAKQHEVSYASGRKTGLETFWSENGKVLWTWQHDLTANVATWTQFWPDGRRKNESTWNTYPQARDLKRHFIGLIADGPAKQWNADGTPGLSGEFVNGIPKNQGAMMESAVTPTEKEEGAGHK